MRRRATSAACCVAAFLAAACAGAPAPDDGAAAPVRWRVVTYNIHAGRGTDDVTNLERIADVIRRLDPDLVALQEVDVGVARSGRVDQAARLGELLDMNHVFGSFMDYQGGRYGMAILSRCAIRRVEPVRLADGNEPRIALTAEIERATGGTITFVDVHFDWVASDSFRIVQATETAERLDDLRTPWILAGDLNDVPGSPTVALFRARAHEAAKPDDRRLTFPSARPEREIDFIFAAPADHWRVTDVEVVAETVASDHRPVVAELEEGAGLPGASALAACGERQEGG